MRIHYLACGMCCSGKTTPGITFEALPLRSKIKQNPRTVSSQSDKKSETPISFVLTCETAKFSHHPKCLAAKGLAAVVTSAIADQIVNARRSFVAVRRHQS